MRVIHQMTLTARLADGSDEWSCPACGRRITLRRPPTPEVTVLEPGDETAVHIGVTEQDAAAAAEAVERYGLGPVQDVPRPPSRPRTDPPADAATPDAATPDAATPDAATPDAATPGATTPDAQDRAWLADIGIDWDGDAAA